MKRIRQIGRVLLGGVLLLTAACNNEEPIFNEEATLNDQMMFNVLHPSQTAKTKATDTGFEVNDTVGLFIVDQSKQLELSGNHVNNMPLVKSADKWSTKNTVYWNKGIYNAYAYYPYDANLNSVDNYTFTLAADQNKEVDKNATSGYEASDFLWARKNTLTAGNEPVNLVFSHRMSRLLVQLVKGEDYEGDFPDEAEVYIHNTVIDATIDLSEGVVTRDRYATKKSMRAKRLGNYKYAAIVVPQRLDFRQPLVEVIIKGVSYLYESKFIFKPGVQHTVKLVVSKNPEQIKIEIGGELENWTE